VIRLKKYLLFLVIGLFWTAEAAAQPEAADYRIGVSDELSIDIRNLGQPEYSIKVRVPQNGIVSIPLLGEMRVRGLSIRRAEDLLESKLLDGYLKKPEVTISITEYRPFYVDGGVESPGAYAFQHGLTVDKAIVLAGGFSGNADVTSITITPASDPTKDRSVSLSSVVAPGDVITVGESITSGAESIYLYGAVGEPGSIAFRKGLTVEKAIVLAGGFTERASKKKITIRRESGDGIEEIKRAKLSQQLEPGDIITIGESFF
jgi:polysaccharide export outer membrane protein